MDSSSGDSCPSHKESAATTGLNKLPSALEMSTWNLKQQTYLCCVFLYLSLHQSNLVTQKSPPYGSRWGFGKEWGAGDGWEGMCASSTSWHLSWSCCQARGLASVPLECCHLSPCKFRHPGTPSTKACSNYPQRSTYLLPLLLPLSGTA